MNKLLLLLLFFASVAYAQEPIIVQDGCTVTVNHIYWEDITSYIAIIGTDSTEQVFHDSAEIIGEQSWVFMWYFVDGYPVLSEYVGTFYCFSTLDIVDEVVYPENYQDGEQIAGVWEQPDGTYHVYCVATGQIAFTFPRRPELESPCEGVWLDDDSILHIGEYTWTQPTQ